MLKIEFKYFVLVLIVATDVQCQGLLSSLGNGISNAAANAPAAPLPLLPNLMTSPQNNIQGNLPAAPAAAPLSLLGNLITPPQNNIQGNVPPSNNVQGNSQLPNIPGAPAMPTSLPVPSLMNALPQNPLNGVVQQATSAIAQSDFFQKLITFIFNLISLFVSPQQLEVLKQTVITFVQTVVNTLINEAVRAFSNANEFVRGADSVLDEGSKQFDRVNNINTEIGKSAFQTVGTAASKLGQHTLGALDTTQNFINDPFRYNPVTAVKNNLPLVGLTEEQKQAEKIRKIKLRQLKKNNSNLYNALVDNIDVWPELKKRTTLLNEFLDQPDKLQMVLQDPSKLVELIQTLEQEKKLP